MNMTQSLSPTQCEQMRHFFRFLLKHNAPVGLAIAEYRKIYGNVRLSDAVMDRRRERFSKMAQKCNKIQRSMQHEAVF